MAKWKRIDSAPDMRTILMYGATEVRTDGTVVNWLMATGCKAGSDYEWDGRLVESWGHKPTHWMPLPEPPK